MFRGSLLSRLAGRLKHRHQLRELAQSIALAPAPTGTTEFAMATFTHPPKHLVRAYLERRARDSKPPPSPEEIRRQLGWGMASHDCKMAAHAG